MTETITTVEQWRRVARQLRREGRSLGFVPTMGALHRGHAALLERSKAENDVTVASVFVNPAQFDDARDLDAYPRTLEEDRALLASLHVDFLFAPDRGAIYPDDYRFRVAERELSTIMEGAHRPGHFDGVLTVVLRLLAIVRPTRAYFGEKDYQQYLLVRDLAAAFFLETEIVPCPTVRESDGLALSSRNVRLSAEARALAGRFARRLAGPGPAAEVERDLQAMGVDVQYVEERFGRRFAAVVIGGVRLIDNVAID
ncbi:MAG: pantoate--beta-alanine ligase [Gemmatimonadales bacterium]